MREHLVLKSCSITAGFQLGFQLLVFWITISGSTKRGGLLFYLLHACSDGCCVSCTCTIELFLHLRQQVVLQEFVDFSPFLIHDAIDAEIQFRMIHHKYLLQFLDETIVVVDCHSVLLSNIT